MTTRWRWMVAISGTALGTALLAHLAAWLNADQARGWWGAGAALTSLAVASAGLFEARRQSGLYPGEYVLWLVLLAALGVAWQQLCVEARENMTLEMRRLRGTDGGGSRPRGDGTYLAPCVRGVCPPPPWGPAPTRLRAPKARP